jgi:hypothetical protein
MKRSACGPCSTAQLRRASGGTARTAAPTLQLALRFFAGTFLGGAFVLLGAGTLLPDDAKLWRSASVRLTPQPARARSRLEADAYTAVGSIDPRGGRHIVIAISGDVAKQPNGPSTVVPWESRKDPV